MNSGVGLRCGWDTMLLLLWHRPVAVAPISPLAWEPPYATSVVLKKKKKKKKKGKGPSDPQILLQTHSTFHTKIRTT